MTLPFVQDNNSSREKLAGFVRGLSETDLARTNAEGWTVSALLVHLAFWDQRMLVLLRRWQREGVGDAPVDPDMINDSLRPIALAMPSQAAIALCLESAEAIDAALEQMSVELYEAIAAAPVHYRFNRSLHRNDHLGEIARILAE